MLVREDHGDEELFDVEEGRSADLGLTCLSFDALCALFFEVGVERRVGGVILRRLTLFPTGHMPARTGNPLHVGRDFCLAEVVGGDETRSCCGPFVDFSGCLGRW